MTYLIALFLHRPPHDEHKQPQRDSRFQQQPFQTLAFHPDALL